MKEHKKISQHNYSYKIANERFPIWHSGDAAIVCGPAQQNRHTNILLLACCIHITLFFICVCACLCVFRCYVDIYAINREECYPMCLTFGEWKKNYIIFIDSKRTQEAILFKMKTKIKCLLCRFFYYIMEQFISDSIE